MSEISDLIRAVPLFSELDEAEFQQIEQVVETIGTLEGTVLFQKGDPSDSFYVVALGRADIRIDDETVIPLGAGEFFGEMGVLNSAPRNADAIAGEDSIFLKIGKAGFDKLLAIDEGIAGKVMKACLERGKAFAVAPTSPGQVSAREVILFYSPRGGVGSTTLATNFTTRLAHLADEQVALLDADLQFGNCHVLLDAQGGEDIAQVAGGRAEPLTQAEVEKLVLELPNKVALVRSPGKTEEADLVKPAHLIGAVEHLHAKYGRLVVDTPSQLDERTLALMDVATKVFLIAEPEIVSLTRIMDCLRLFDLAGLPLERFEIVLNKTGRGGYATEDIERILKRPVYAEVGWDRKTTNAAIHDGKSVFAVAKDSPVSVGIANLARRYLNPFGAAQGSDLSEAPKKAGFSFWGLFKDSGEAEPAPRG